MNGSIKGVNCPICGESLVVRAEFDPGEPMVMYYPDGSGYPGTGPSIEDWEVSDYNCDCRGVLLHPESYDALVEEAVNATDVDQWEFDEPDEEY